MRWPMRTINVIAAADEEFGFGKDGKIPWHYPEDFKFFKETTKDSVCIMGRKTFDDLLTYAKGKAVLPGRQCIVLSSTELDLGPRPNAMSIPAMNSWVYNNIHRATSVGNALDMSMKWNMDVYFIGGESVFESGMKLADCVYLTRIPGTHNCDRFFPFKELKEKFHLYNTRNGDNGLVFQTYIHNVFGTNNPHN